MRRRPAEIEAARKLLRACAAAEREEPAAAAARLYEHLLGTLAPLIGNAGARGLFERSAKLTTVEYPCFEELRRGVAGEKAPPADCLRTLLGTLEPDTAADAAGALYGTLLTLLVDIIGEQLVSKVVLSAIETKLSKEME